jgi:hypothetical protein
MGIEVVLLTIIVMSFVATVVISMSIVRINQRYHHHKKMIDGFYNYHGALAVGMVDKDDSMPDNYEELRAVRAWDDDGFLLFNNHILDQELYNKVVFYSDTFSGVDFNSMMEFEVDRLDRKLKLSCSM